eukprot:TRINITY_DN4321_c0_g1_i1.p1 TRINITY_DN4321_c0_g1~~TRINITY_DN4321_c0_g1_i1.p1  ORF type:complete len:1964 (+),score=351.62 TRINITY_DN4321_c0_g1_i1:38-5929(+)
MAGLRHFARCLGAVLQKNFTLKSRQWTSTLLELMLPVALMGLLIWIRTEVHKEDKPAMSYIDSSKNNPTWFSSSALDAGEIPGLPSQLEALCKADSALCPEIFANATWGLRKEHFTGSAIDGLLLVHMALSSQQLGVVGPAGKGLYDFIVALPGYSEAVRYFESEDAYAKYLSSRTYGFSTETPGLFGALVVNSAANCSKLAQPAMDKQRASSPESEQLGGSEAIGTMPGSNFLSSLPASEIDSVSMRKLTPNRSGASPVCKGDWDVVIHLNASGPGTTDLQGSTDINTKLIPEVSPRQRGLTWSSSRVYWSGGLEQGLGVPLPTGGLIDLQSLVYSWIYSSTGAFQLQEPSTLPHCQCTDQSGKLTDNLADCNSSQLFETAIRTLTPYWSTAALGDARAGCLGRFSGLLPVSVREVPFPTPAYTSDPFATFVKGVFGLFFVLVYIWPLTRIMKSLVEDKEARINEVMKMMGMPAEAITIGWYLTYGLLWILPAFLMVAICWGTVFEHSNKMIVMLFFWLFAVCVITLCSMISVFFARAKTASVVGALIFFLLYFPYLFVASSGSSMQTKVMSCLSPPVALSLGATIIAQLESSGDGTTWGNMGDPVDNISMGQVIGMLVLDTLVFAVLAWYLDRVLVVGFGTSQPWWFVCSKRFWKPSTSALTEEEVQDLEQGFDDVAPDNPRYEAVSSALASERSVLVRNLCKEFNTADGKVLKAVQNVSLNLYSGQIFCLLGHNGAGKTTTINMLSGLLPVSSGDAIVYGKSVSKDMQQIRQDLGVCPQHDVIWSGMTVKEHLEFFAKAKGVSAEAIDEEVAGLIQDVGLQEKQNSFAGTLSGGQKRRLSAAIALCGGSRVVFLDEPSSGVDPFSRRELWDCLRQKKESRTLILTTHFMDEAEELGDRIAIMAAGQVKCVGSALFLKSQYGVGYTLTIAKAAPASEEKSKLLDELVLSECSKAELLSDVGTELAYRMPFEESGNFPKLFEQLESEPGKYGIELFGVSVTTLEEVFLRVGRDHTEADRDADERLQQTNFVRQISSERERSISSFQHDAGAAADGSLPASSEPYAPAGQDTVEQSFANTFARHVHALLAKRYHNARRDRKAWCCQIVLPLLFLLTALFTMRFAGVGDYDVASLTFANLPGEQEVLVAGGPEVEAAQVAAFVAGSGLPFLELPHKADASQFSDELVSGYYRANGLKRYGALRLRAVPDWSKPDATRSVGSYTVQGFRQPGSVQGPNGALTVPVGTIWGENATVLPGSPSVPLGQLNNRLQVDLFWNSTARDALPIFYGAIHEMTLRNALGTEALKDSTVRIGNQPFPLTSSQKDLTDTQTSLNLALGFAFIPASVCAFVVLERETGSKHLQVISGVNFVSYWLATWIWDIINYLVPAVLSMLLMAVFGVESLVGSENLPWTTLAVLLYGVSCTSFTYMLSFFFRSHTSAQNLMLVFYLFTGGILMIVAIILAVIPNTQDLQNHVLVYIFRLLPNFCLADSLTNLITRPNPIWMSRGCPFSGCAPYDLLITGWDLTYMGFGSIVWFMATLLLELAFATPKLRAALQLGTVDTGRGEEAALDRQVQQEKDRVQSGAADGEMVVLKGLRKVFPGRQGAPPKVAVEDMYFAIPEGECFGYLGMNGAGKTTTMKMLTGEELCTSGEATLGGFDIKTQQHQVRRLIGYCPQFDALIGTLTAREHLTLFARIKGYPEENIRSYVDSMLDRLTLRPYADKQAYSFSGGTRRKLSLGLSLVGNPRCVFLDEPTTGVDPESRRFMWRLISNTMLGRSVILTTHSMDECEALCSRIGIMVNGRLVCLGSASQLKAIHGYGYQFEVTFKTSTDLAAAHAELRSFLEKQFPEGLRTEEGGGATSSSSRDQGPQRARARYRLPKNQKPISEIFRLVEQHKTKLNISEYSVSETTLEQLFIQFARHQVEEGEDGVSAAETSSASSKEGSQLQPQAEEARALRGSSSNL